MSSDLPTTEPRSSQPAAGALQRSLKRFDITAMAVAAVISFDTVGQIATGGGEAATWTAAIALFFLVPYALLFAETGAAFPQEGGPYVWVKLALGRPAALTTLMYWVTNPIWLGGSLVFLAAQTWDGFVFHLGSGTVADYTFKLLFVWIAILTAVVSLRRGKWITTVGAATKVLALAVFTLTAVLYGVRHGFHGLAGTSFAPTTTGFLALVPILLFAYVGFEAPNAAGEEMHDPQRDVPAALGRSATVAACCYLLPVLALLAVVPAHQVTGIGGFMEGARLVFGVYGAAAGPLLKITAVMFVFALLTQGSAWMIVSDRMQAMAAADGASSPAPSAPSTRGSARRCAPTSSPEPWPRCSCSPPCGWRTATRPTCSPWCSPSPSPPCCCPTSSSSPPWSCCGCAAGRPAALPRPLRLLRLPVLRGARLRVDPHRVLVRALPRSPGTALRHRLRLPRRLGCLPGRVRDLHPRHRRPPADRRGRRRGGRPPPGRPPGGSGEPGAQPEATL
ncbi:APC family permease [Streptomyces mexicanus]